ncbi:MAG: DUF2283 domain-containing protein [candidate division WOR-3 bacterium]
MTVTYDQQADAMYVKFKRKKVDRTRGITDYFIVDLDQEGEVIGLEILAASRHVPDRRIRAIEVVPLAKQEEQVT